MPTPAATLDCLTRLLRNVSNPPDPETLPDLAADWSEILAPLSDVQLRDATVAHLRHPERGRFWPTPADLLSAAGATSAPKLADPDAEAWERILHHPRGQSIRGITDDAQFLTMQAMNGPWDAQNTSDPIRLAQLRRRFLDGCAARRNPPVALLEGGRAPELPDNVRAFVGGEESPDRAAARRRGIARSGS